MPVGEKTNCFKDLPKTFVAFQFENPTFIVGQKRIRK